MRIRVFLTVVVLALLSVGSGSGNETVINATTANWIEPVCDWERHACEICGKTIREKVEYTSPTNTDASDCIYLGTGVLYFYDDPPRRTTAEKLHGEVDYKVCPYCLGKYTRAFGETVRKAAKAFIDEAKAKESQRRAEVAQENTQEELRRCEEQLRKYTEQVKKLTEKMEAIKGQLK